MLVELSVRDLGVIEDLIRVVGSGMAARAGGLGLRVGGNVGDVVIEGDDILGDGVNIASRLEGVAGGYVMTLRMDGVLRHQKITGTCTVDGQNPDVEGELAYGRGVDVIGLDREQPHGLAHEEETRRAAPARVGQHRADESERAGLLVLRLQGAAVGVCPPEDPAVVGLHQEPFDENLCELLCIGPGPGELGWIDVRQHVDHVVPGGPHGLDLLGPLAVLDTAAVVGAGDTRQQVW